MRYFRLSTKSQNKYLVFSASIFISLVLVHFVVAKEKSRARDLGIPFDGKTGCFFDLEPIFGVKITFLESERRFV